MYIYICLLRLTHSYTDTHGLRRQHVHVGHNDLMLLCRNLITSQVCIYEILIHDYVHSWGLGPAPNFGAAQTIESYSLNPMQRQPAALVIRWLRV